MAVATPAAKAAADEKELLISGSEAVAEGLPAVVDADGLAISPGFIDFHTHLDAQLLWDPLATSSCYHGVTTVIPGNCGLSLAPCKEQDREVILKSFERVEAITLPALKAGVKWGFTAFGEYLDALRGNLGINVASLVGHCALRQFVMGEASIERAATDVEASTVLKRTRAAGGSLRDAISSALAAVGMPKYTNGPSAPVNTAMAARNMSPIASDSVISIVV